MADAPIDQPAPDTPDDPAPSVMPKCGSCEYFKLFTIEERNGTGDVTMDGDGWCLAEPPKIGQRVTEIGKLERAPKRIAITPVYPPTFAHHRCRFWREAGEFAGDAGIAIASDSGLIAQHLERLAQYVREMVGAAKGSG